MEALTAFCKADTAGLYMDYNITRFSSSGAGISKAFDYARNTVGQKALVHKRILGSDKEENTAEYFVARDQLVQLVKKASDNVRGLGIGGISLSDAASGKYSDYSVQSFYTGNGFADDYRAIADYNRKNGSKMLAEGANLYAAVTADIITGAPDCSDKNALFYTDIPFYQLDYKGYVPMTCSAVNLAADSKERVLSAAEGGMGLGFTLTENYDNSLFSAEENIFHSVLYSAVSQSTQETVSEYGGFFVKINGADVMELRLLSETMRSSVYDNGVTVYVNYGNKAENTAAGTVEAGSFIYTEEKQ